ncbi:MAG: YidC/Oxa1 family membrane protein insertase [Clostridia bacterium]|nr:YidC/Oxa1 family membrane protein insertase [Clostridia bacterium]
MKKTNKTIGGRILAAALVVLMLLGTLVGCASTASTVVLTVDSDVFLEIDTTEPDHKLGATELKAIADMLASTYNANFKTSEMLVAAYRGYDMLAENFDDTAIDPTEVGEPDLAAAVKLIEKANLEAKGEYKVLTEKYKELGEADVRILISSLKTDVDLDAKGGLWDTLLGWIGVALGWITNVLAGGYYIIGICIFAIVIEILMLPLVIKQHKSSIKQAKLKPKEMAIRKKYAGRDDQATRQKLQAELGEMYQRENVNAAAGCLPLVIQMPIILALYNIVIDPLHYVLGQASGMTSALNLYYTTAHAAGGLGATATQASRGSIALLSEIGSRLEGIKDFMLLGNGDAVYERMSSLNIPNFTLGKFNLGVTPNFDDIWRLRSAGINGWLLLVPLLTFVIYFFSMRLTKKFTYQPTNMAAGDDRQAACSSWMLDIMMPMMSVWITFVVPALIGIYWMFKSVLSTLSRFIISRILPYPTFTEDDYRAAEREYAGKASKRSAAPAQHTYSRGTTMVDGRPKSLFHMDDDDYLARVEAEKDKANEDKDAPKDDKGTLDGVSLKDDDRHGKNKKSDDQ